MWPATRTWPYFVFSSLQYTRQVEQGKVGRTASSGHVLDHFYNYYFMFVSFNKLHTAHHHALYYKILQIFFLIKVTAARINAFPDSHKMVTIFITIHMENWREIKLYELVVCDLLHVHTYVL